MTDGSIEDMMQHLDDARANRTDDDDDEYCPNCDGSGPRETMVVHQQTNHQSGGHSKTSAVGQKRVCPMCEV